jgi:hypothetical protein
MYPSMASFEVLYDVVQLGLMALFTKLTPGDDSPAARFPRELADAKVWTPAWQVLEIGIKVVEQDGSMACSTKVMESKWEVEEESLAFAAHILTTEEQNKKKAKNVNILVKCSRGSHLTRWKGTHIFQFKAENAK